MVGKLNSLRRSLDSALPCRQRRRSRSWASPPDNPMPRTLHICMSVSVCSDHAAAMHTEVLFGLTEPVEQPVNGVRRVGEAYAPAPQRAYGDLCKYVECVKSQQASLQRLAGRLCLCKLWIGDMMSR